MTYWLEVYAACVGMNLVLCGFVLADHSSRGQQNSWTFFAVLMALAMTGPVFTFLTIGAIIRGAIGK